MQYSAPSTTSGPQWHNTRSASLRRIALGLTLACSSAGLLSACEDKSVPPAATKALKSAPAEQAKAPAPTKAPELRVDLAGLAYSGESSTIGFRGTKVIGGHDGGFKRFSGRLALKAGTNLIEKTAVVIDMSSVYTDDQKLTRHLKRDDFFDVEKYPTASFISTGVEEGGDGKVTHFVKGNLTLRGVTKPITIPLAANFSDPKLIRLKTTFKINRRDFGILYDGMEDNLINDDVTLRFDLKIPKAGQ